MTDEELLKAIDDLITAMESIEESLRPLETIADSLSEIIEIMKERNATSN